MRIGVFIAAVAALAPLSHPYSLAFAMRWAGLLHIFRREAIETRELAEASIVAMLLLGFPDKALEYSREALTYSRTRTPRNGV